jgi:hypothetical protein
LAWSTTMNRCTRRSCAFRRIAALSLAAGLAATAPVAAADQLPSSSARSLAGTINVKRLSLETGFFIDGPSNYDPIQLGMTATTAGDMNGDGFDDVAYGAGLGTFASVYYGGKRKTFKRPELGIYIGRGERVPSIIGQLSGGGDFNDDGLDDLVVGGAGVETVWVIWGARQPKTVKLDPDRAPRKTSFRIDGPAPQGKSAPGFGASVAMLGDVNGDGIDDVAIGAPQGKTGMAYVVLGRRNGKPTLAVDDLDGKNGFRLVGEKKGSAGTLVASAGDVNGDGIADILVGDPGTDPGGRVEAGTLYVVFGRKGGFPRTIRLSDLNGKTGFAIPGALAGDRLGQRPERGTTAASAGDFNGDGIGDLVLTADGREDTDAARAGFVIFGSNSRFPKVFDITSLNGRNGFRAKGSGRSASGIGDFNGDGIGDIMFGGGADPLFGYVVLGTKKRLPGLVELGATEDVSMVRIRGFGGSGPVAGAGDVDRDGLDDIVIGAPWFDDHRPDIPEGGGYVLFGQDWKK